MKSLIFILSLMLFPSLSQGETIHENDFNVNFQSPKVIGTSLNINVHSIPLKTNPTGQVVYYDVVFRFSMSGPNPILTLVSAEQSYSANSIESFLADTYADGEGAQFIVSGPAVANGRASWNIRKTKTKKDDRILEASWVTGPLVNHPMIPNPDKKLNSGAYSYGVLGKETWPNWSTGNVLGFKQIGNILEITNLYKGSFYESFSITKVN